MIEHIGRDNSLYSFRNQPTHLFGDIDAGAKLATLLRPGGRLLITVPFGRLEDHGWFVQYDAGRIEALVEATRCEVMAAEYYGCGPSGGLVLRIRKRWASAHIAWDHASAVACLELTRPSADAP